MKMNRHSLLSAAASLVLVGLAACSSSSTPKAAAPDPVALKAAQAANSGNYTRTIFLGDSLTAGYQSNSLIDSSQVNGWAPLFAKQAGTPIVLPLIAPPGAPNQLTLEHLANPPVLGQLPGVTIGRDDPNVQPTDLAVPGFLVNDVLNTRPELIPSPGQQQITQLVLGYPAFMNNKVRTAAQAAVDANATTIFLWIGNNDALNADFTGTTAGLTPLATFTTQYQQLIAYLQANSPAHLVLLNIPDVTLVAYLQPAAKILAQYSAATGVPVANLSALLGIQAGDFLNQTGLAQIGPILKGAQKGPISDAGVLSAAEAATVRAQVTAYNQVIAAQATAAGATLVDINTLFNFAAAKGVVYNGIPGTTAFLGGVFSLDGIHPTNTGYAIIANYVIDTLNANYASIAGYKAVPDVNIAAIAAVDPLYPPYPGHKGVITPGQQLVMPVVPQLSAERMQALLGEGAQR